MSALLDPVNRFTVFSAVLSCLILGVIGQFVYWMTDNKPPVVSTSGEFLGWQEPNLAIVRWTGIRQRTCDGTGYRWLVDGIIYQLPSVHLPVKIGEKEGSEWQVTVAVPIPPSIDHEVKYSVRVDYYCNPLQRLAPLKVPLPEVLIPYRLG